ncbi:LysR family transcriptional regulator [Bailinhaonella thermotolerans]|uniref:LysR family transcriptional regulator n=1 Tax=Bailinhaonella thermotolerans TaxID=1070861 RepID=A0A3A4B190_9ACTN|nr:LysR family transcriptional regulator [Bailinhaonella thermotolerans]RJL35495.1 LysR family transcriptional regulator [Bailinhaonella thermotolerans]
MELRQLSHFLAVARRRSFTQAARDVNVVQSSLSASIRQLERELGATLFDRTTRRVELSPAGRALLPIARHILADARAAKAEISAVQGLLRGQVALGTIQMLTWVDLPEALARFREAHPGVEISLLEAPVDEMIEALRSGELDLAYLACGEEDLPAALTVIASDTEPLAVATGPGHPLAGQTGVRLADLEAESFVEFQAGTGLQTVVDRLCLDAGLNRRIVLRTTQLELLVSLVRHGLGIAILPVGVAEEAGLRTIPIIGDTATRTVALVTRTGHDTNPAVSALINLLRPTAPT